MAEMAMEWMSVLVSAALTGLVGIGVAFLQSKIKSDRVAQALERLKVATEGTVCELQQEWVDGWKTAGSGKLSAEQIRQLGAQCLEKTLRKMDAPAISLMESIGMDLQECIQGFAEKKILMLKEKQ